MLSNKDTKKILDKFNQAQEDLVIQTVDYPLSVLLQMVSEQRLDLEPHYQRRDRWSQDKQSQLIESFLLNVPVPPIYLSEDKVGTYSVIDGKQRITAGIRYIQNEYPLKGLEKLVELNGLYNKDLPGDLQSAVSSRPYLRVIILLKQSHPELKYEVFQRLNRGGESLSEQEVRNSLFRGELNDMIYKCAEEDFLRKQLKIRGPNSSNYKNMQDAEWVLRYFALRDSWQSQKGSLSETLNDFMRANQDMSSADLEELRLDYVRSLNICECIFGQNAFKRPEKDSFRDQALVGMYDAQMIAAHHLTDEKVDYLRKEATNIVEEFRRRWFTSNDKDSDFAGFDDAVRTATNTPSKIVKRISTMTEFLRDYH